MKKFLNRLFFSSVFCLFFIGFGVLRADDCLKNLTVVNNVAPQFLVQVYSIKDPTEPLRSASTGSGELIRGFDGVVRILTNAHVVGNTTKEVWVKFDGQVFAEKVKILGVDTLVDLALLEAPKLLPPNSKPIEIAKKPVSIGDCIYALGYPSGERTVSFGTVVSVSSPNKSAGIDLFFSHQAPIAPGSSGGALVRKSSSGDFELVGINTLVGIKGEGDQKLISNFGFALRAEIIKRSMQRLERETYVEHAFLGLLPLHSKEINPFLFEFGVRRSYPPPVSGVFIVAVLKDSPAAASGLLPGDFIKLFEVRVGEEWHSLPFENTNRLVEEIFFDVPPGTKIRLTIERGSEISRREFVLDKYPTKKTE